MAQSNMTHPGVGPLTALAYVLITDQNQSTPCAFSPLLDIRGRERAI